MARDATVTRQKILTEAIAEFARHGFAGGRVDRIADAAGCNKSLIYRYFGSKDGLFDAAVDAAMTRNVAAVPIDACDLPGYAVRMAELFARDPAIERLAAWDRLERDGRAYAGPALAGSRAHKLAAIRAAQAAGTVTDRLPAELLLQLVVSIAMARHDAAPATDGPEPEPVSAATRADLIREAVTRLIRP